MKKFNSFTVCVLVSLFIIPCFTISYGQVPPSPTITSSKGAAFCEGDATILTATSAGATNYLWSTGATTQSINVSTTGSYKVTASNASGNSAPAKIYINAGMVTPVAIERQAAFGTGHDEDVFSIQQTADGGYIIAGTTYTPTPLPAGQHGGYDCFIIKINSNLNIQWKKYFGGSNDDKANEIRKTSDGGYIIAGGTRSNNGDISGNHAVGFHDYLIIKIDSTGVIQWQKCLGGTETDHAYSIKQTPDGGYIVAGYAFSNNGDVTGNHSSGDIWVVKLDSVGIIQWQKCFGGSANDLPLSIILTGGGYIVSGLSSSNDGDVSGHHGSQDYWIIKLDLGGTLIWQKCLGGSNIEGSSTGISYTFGTTILQTSDGGYITCGSTQSTNHDVSGNHGGFDAWIVKLDSTGTIEWQKCYGGSGSEQGYAIGLTSDGGYVLTGGASAVDGDVAGTHGGFDAWIVKLDNEGAIKWQKCIGGTLTEYRAKSTEQTPDGGFIFAGPTNSNDNDVSGNHGGYDIWIVKLGAEGTCPVPSAQLKTTNITATSAKLNWYATPCVERYNIKYRQAGTTAWTEKIVLNNIGSKSLTGLMPSTDYEWRIKTRCSSPPKYFSKYSPIQYFTTQALRQGESITQNNITGCNIFPNPARGNFSLSFNSDCDSKGDIEIYNTLGELVYNKKIEINEDENTMEINLTGAPAGVFFLNIKSGNRIYWQKLVKE